MKTFASIILFFLGLGAVRAQGDIFNGAQDMTQDELLFRLQTMGPNECLRARVNDTLYYFSNQHMDRIKVWKAASDTTGTTYVNLFSSPYGFMDHLVFAGSLDAENLDRTESYYNVGPHGSNHYTVADQVKDHGEDAVTRLIELVRNLTRSILCY